MSLFVPISKFEENTGKKVYIQPFLPFILEFDKGGESGK
jgi:hypothetical protein